MLKITYLIVLMAIFNKIHCSDYEESDYETFKDFDRDRKDFENDRTELTKDAMKQLKAAKIHINNTKIEIADAYLNLYNENYYKNYLSGPKRKSKRDIHDNLFESNIFDDIIGGSDKRFIKNNVRRKRSENKYILSDSKNDSIKINDIEIKKTPVESEDIDFESSYEYIDGEMITIACEGNLNAAEIIYNNITALLANKYLRLKLTKTMKSKYIDIKFKYYRTYNNANKPKYIYTYRLNFVHKEITEYEKPRFIVNGLILAPYKEADHFLYEYIEDEILEIKVLFNQNIYSIKKFDPVSEMSGINTTNGESKIITGLKKDNGSQFECLLNFNRSIEHPNVTIKDVTITLTLNLLNESFVNVPLSKMLMFYKESHKTVISYPYEDNKMSIFSCYSSDTQPTWTYTVQQVKEEEQNDKICKPISDKICKNMGFTLKENYTTSTVTCETVGHRTQIVLVRQKRPKEPEIPEPQTEDVPLFSSLDDINNAGIRNTEIPERDFLKPSTKLKWSDFWSDNKIYIICGAVIVIVIIIIILLICIYKKRKRVPQGTSNEINYENLPEHNEGPMAHPSQWDTYSKPIDGDDSDAYSLPINQRLDEMYAKPTPKILRSTNNTLNKDLYAKPTPKTERHIENPYAEILKNIAEKQLKNQATIIETESPYAEISIYTNEPNQGIYVNEFQTGPYVNAEGERDVYESPAYCEVGYSSAK